MENYLKKIIQEYFDNDKFTTHGIFHLLSLYIYVSESGDTDLPILARLLDEKSLQTLISFYDGDNLKLPTKEEYKRCMLTALCFWLRVFKNYSWDEIRDYLGLTENDKDIFSSMSLGGKIGKIKSMIGQELIEAMENVDENEFVTYFQNQKVLYD